MDLAARPPRARRLIMAAPSYACTISRAAEILGEDEELLWDVAMEVEPEDGKLWIHGTGEQETIAFTDRGMENLRELLAEHKRWKAQHPRP
jgi:hypothetical protein